VTGHAHADRLLIRPPRWARPATGTRNDESFSEHAEAARSRESQSQAPAPILAASPTRSADRHTHRSRDGRPTRCPPRPPGPVGTPPCWTPLAQADDAGGAVEEVRRGSVAGSWVAHRSTGPGPDATGAAAARTSDAVLCCMEDVLVAVARPDRSGRLSARGLLRALGWGRGHRLGVAFGPAWLRPT